MNLWTFDLEAKIVSSLLASTKKPNIKKKIPKKEKLVMTKNKITLCINFQKKKSLFID